MRVGLVLVVWVFLSSFVISNALGALVRDVDLEPFEEAFKARFHLQGESPEELEKVLEDYYESIQIGRVELLFAGDLLDEEENFEKFKKTLLATFLIQLKWAHWSNGFFDSKKVDGELWKKEIEDGKYQMKRSGGQPELPSKILRKITDTMSDFGKWIEKLTLKKWRDRLDEKSDFEKNLKTVNLMLDVNLNEVEESEKDGEAVEAEEREVSPPEIKRIFCFTRQDFLELIGYVSTFPRHGQARQEGTHAENWTSKDWGGYRILPLEYKDPNSAYPTAGFAMDRRKGEEKGVEQFVAHAILRERIAHQYPHFGTEFIDSIAADAVVEVFEKDNTQFGGYAGANTTSEYWEFVPGVNPFPEGSEILPPNSADAFYRLTKAEDRCVAPLRRSQEDGEETAKENKKSDRVSKPDGVKHFYLHTVQNKDKRSGEEKEVAFLMEAPFLGQEALSSQMEAGWLSALQPKDRGYYSEFLRAYRIAFVYWLRTAAMKKEGKLNEKGKGGKEAPSFETFYRLLSEVRSGEDLAAAIQEVYGESLSVLEGYFLQWLAKQKALK